MYAGYRLKIEGSIVKNSLMKKGSYSAKEVRRVIKSFYDAAGDLREAYSPKTKQEITFTFREHTPEEHAEIMAFFADTRRIEVEYYDDKADEYRTGYFKAGELSRPNSNAFANKIQYGEIAVTLKEK